MLGARDNSNGGFGAIRFACVLLVNVLFHLPYNAGRATIQVQMLRSGSSGLEVGTVSALFALPMLIGSLWVGKWIERSGTRAPSRGAAALVLAGLGAYAALPPPHVYPLVAILIGTAYCFWYLSVNTCIALQSTGRTRFANFSRLSLSFSLSSFLSGLLVSTVDVLGTTDVMLVLLAGAICGSLLHAVCLRRLFVHAPTRQTENTDAPRGEASPRGNRRSPALCGLYAAMLLTGVGWDSILFGLPFLTQTIGGTRLLGTSLAVFAAAAALSRLWLTAAMTRLAVRTRLIVCLVTIAAGMTAIGLSASESALVASVALSGLGLGMIKPCISDAVCANSPAAATTSNLSVLPVLLAFSAVTMPAVLGWCANVLPASMWYFAVASLAFGIAAVLSRIQMH